MRTGPLLHEVSFHREEAIDLRVVKRSHSNLITTRDDRNEIRIRVGNDVIENIVLLLDACVISIVDRSLRQVHASDIIERVCGQTSGVVVRRIDAMLTGTVRVVVAGDLRVAVLQAMLVKEATGWHDARNISLDLDLAHFFGIVL